MDNYYIDLHLHTLHSDGMLTVEELLSLVASENISCASITDHDTFDAYATAPGTAERLGLELISGIEISSVSNGRDIHILGYFCDTRNAELLAALEIQREKRKDRVRAIIEKLCKLGVNLSYEQVEQRCFGASISRPHIASALVEAKYVDSYQEAFSRYLKEGAAAYCPPAGISSREAILLIEKAGGLAVMAHPEYTNADELIPKLVEYGIAGIEVYNYKTAKSIKKYRKIAKKYRLVETGGSDFHGIVNGLFGKQNLPYSIVEELKKKLRQS
ncbi:MAG: PHP domain-containing protein [Candidatus Fibromonas sp.]|jgi:predicted metal-dependent phosphoesterase TrpH|nr:PHP domain-containing protein [Candidatus Fibromonas sp.]